MCISIRFTTFIWNIFLHIRSVKEIVDLRLSEVYPAIHFSKSLFKYISFLKILTFLERSKNFL